MSWNYRFVEEDSGRITLREVYYDEQDIPEYYSTRIFEQEDVSESKLDRACGLPTLYASSFYE